MVTFVISIKLCYDECSADKSTLFLTLIFVLLSLGATIFNILICLGVKYEKISCYGMYSCFVICLLMRTKDFRGKCR
ncbi:hypothetical protein MIDIC_10073 [Alphaproteobacteria bacterium]